MTEREFEFSLGATDPCGRVKHKFLLETFQELAEKDAAKYNFAVFQTIKRGMTWVLRSYRLDFAKYPCREDKVLKIKTYAEIYKNLFSLRTFELRNDKDELLGVAKTWWVLIDITRKRPLRLDKVAGLSEFLQKVSNEYPLEVKIPRVKKANIEDIWRVRWQDLDVNDHTNHTVYFGWALESVPFEIPENYAPVFTEAQYLRPIPRMEIICLTEEARCEGEKKYIHTLVGKDGEEYARLVSRWKFDGRAKVEN